LGFILDGAGMLLGIFTFLAEDISCIMFFSSWIGMTFCQFMILQAAERITRLHNLLFQAWRVAIGSTARILRSGCRAMIFHRMTSSSIEFLPDPVCTAARQALYVAILSKKLTMMDPDLHERQAHIVTNTMFMWAGVYVTVVNRLSHSFFSSQYTAFAFALNPLLLG